MAGSTEKRTLLRWAATGVLHMIERALSHDLQCGAAQGLALFQGGVLMISHDAHLIESTVDELWVIEGGTATPFHGSFVEYKRSLSA